MLTLKDLKEMKPNQVFTSGIFTDSYTGIPINNSGKMIGWVAVRGYIHDWCIYISDSLNIQYIIDYGDKLFLEENIKKLVPCDEEAFAMYRY